MDAARVNAGAGGRVEPAMARRKFTTALAPANAKYHGGYSAGAFINPSRWADELLGSSIPGPWLCCYMIRRFGWPNIGSDPHKDLCAWSLTTPIEGLYLTVRPYMGHDGQEKQAPFCGNLHFGVRFTREVGDELDRDPQRERYWAKRDKAIRRWWDREGMRLYIFAESKDPEDKSLLVKLWGSKDDMVVGLYRRSEDCDLKMRSLPAKVHPYFFFWMAEFLGEQHPSVLPKWKGRATPTPTAFQRRARAAIEATLRDLLRPVRVRDIIISPFGDVERRDTAREKCGGLPEVEPFEGAGAAPSYWYSPRRKRQEATP